MYQGALPFGRAIADGTEGQLAKPVGEVDTPSPYPGTDPSQQNSWSPLFASHAGFSSSRFLCWTYLHAATKPASVEIAPHGHRILKTPNGTMVE